MGSLTTENRNDKKKCASVLHPKVYMCFSLSYNEMKRGHTMFPPSNHLVIHICVFNSFALYVSLTLSLASLSAPAPNNSSTVAV